MPATTPAYYPPGSPYAPEPSHGSGGEALTRANDAYCAQAVADAEAAATQAAATGTARDARRAQRAAGFARRDCR